MPCPRHPTRSENLATCSRCAGVFCSDCRVTLDELVYCGACKLEQVRDLLAGADGTRLPLASLSRRLSALLTDSVIFSPLPLAGFVLLLSSGFDRPPPLAARVLWGVLVSVAFILYEALLLWRNGQTLGKRSAQIRVVTFEGEPLSRGQAWGRASSRALLGLLFIDYLPVLFTRERLCLHDLLAKTRVVSWRR